jgi:hypothetical protein
VTQGLWLSGLGAAARADDSHLLAEPTEYTSVLDAFDVDSLLDVSVGLSFRRSQDNSTVERERSGMGDTIAGRTLPVAMSRQVTTALALELGVGVWRDLMLYGRVPLVLSDTRVLQAPSGVPLSEVNDALHAAGQPQAPLISPNFKSATRSGVPALELGVAWGIVNQYRTPYLPTWVVLLETRIGVGKLIKACEDGTRCDTGINRGTASLALESRWSYRVRWIEPYLGLRWVAEFATGASEAFTPHGDQPGYVDATPPSVRELTVGSSFVAWEDRGRFQRLSIDLRARAAYVSAGRDNSVLYDALGSSANPSLTEPYTNAGGQVVFNGLTHVASYARLGAELAVVTQAARYVRFRLGVAFTHATPHLLTDTAACLAGGDGSCINGRVNALYRPVIDLPGQRFLVNGNLTYDLFATATGEF